LPSGRFLSLTKLNILFLGNLRNFVSISGQSICVLHNIHSHHMWRCNLICGQHLLLITWTFKPCERRICLDYSCCLIQQPVNPHRVLNLRLYFDREWVHHGWIGWIWRIQVYVTRHPSWVEWGLKESSSSHQVEKKYNRRYRPTMSLCCRQVSLVKGSPLKPCGVTGLC